MGLFKKGLFVKSAPESEEKQEVKPATTSVQFSTAAPSYTPAAPIVVNNSEFKVLLEKELESVSSPSVKDDYIAFRKAVDSLKGMIPDEGTRFQVTVTSRSVDVRQLMESIDIAIRTLKQEREKFLAAIQQTQGTDVSSRNNRIQILQKENQDMANKIATNTAEMGKLQMEVSSATSAIASKQASFESAFNEVLSVVEADKKKAQSTIKQ